MNEKRRRFVNAYVNEAAGNATKAAEIAGYSPKSARVQGSQLLALPDVRQAVADKLAKAEAKADVQAADVVQELSTVAFTKTDITERGKIKALELLAKYKRLIDQAPKDTGSRITVNIGFLQRDGGIGDSSPAITINAEPLEISHATKLIAPTHLAPRTPDEAG